jgi:hypothetical protein
MANATTEETLNLLHEEKCKEMEASGNLFDYLMDAMIYLKNQDLPGWQQHFQPAPLVVAPKAKRLKMSPITVLTTPLPPCIECLKDFVIEDVAYGQYVCVSCGLIQSRVVSMEAHAHCSMDALKNRSRVYIHRYSRISYFWTVLRLIQGETSPVIPDETLSLLRAGIVGDVTAESVNKSLRAVGLAKKYRRHRWSLSRMLGGKPEYAWTPESTITMLKMFRKIEYYWKYFRKTRPKATSFFSYPGLIYNFTTVLGLHPPTSLLLKSIVLRQKQHDLYMQLNAHIATCESIGNK